MRYEWQRPGELIHVDIKKLGRFARAGHRVTGQRNTASAGKGWEYAHVAIDDCSRFSYVEILPDQKRYTATRFWLRAVREFRRRGIFVQRVLTDNGGAYRSRPFRKVCRWLGIVTKRMRPYRRQSGAIHPNAAAEMGLCRTLRHFRAAPCGVADLAALL